MRIEVYSGPDEKGRWEFAKFWMADYHPGDPAGEYRWAERGQHFHAPLKTHMGSVTEVIDMRGRPC
jgi:hypothetical protein